MFHFCNTWKQAVDREGWGCREKMQFLVCFAIKSANIEQVGTFFQSVPLRPPIR